MTIATSVGVQSKTIPVLKRTPTAKIVLQTGPGASKMNSPVSPARIPAGIASTRTRQELREKNKLTSPTIPPTAPADATRIVNHHEPLADKT